MYRRRAGALFWAFCLVLILVVLWLWVQAHAQRETEVNIPIGQAPGISGTDVAVLGDVIAVDLERNVVGVLTVEGYQFFLFLDGLIYSEMDKFGTVYLDCSEFKIRNRYVTPSFLEIGRRVEMKIAHRRWLKIKAKDRQECGR